MFFVWLVVSIQTRTLSITTEQRTDGRGGKRDRILRNKKAASLSLHDIKTKGVWCGINQYHIILERDRRCVLHHHHCQRSFLHYPSRGR